MRRLCFLWAFLFFACASNQHRQPASTLEMAVPEENAFRGWRPVTAMQTSSELPSLLPRIELACGDPYLKPTHPQMTTKLYHEAEVGTYDHFRLQGDSPACALQGKRRDARGALNCARPDLIYRIVVSDLYSDDCGNVYRGYRALQFFRREEDMGTLFSPGRSMRKRPGSEFENDFLPSATEAVAAAEFSALRLATEEEKKAAARERARALAQGFREENGLFVLP